MKRPPGLRRRLTLVLLLVFAATLAASSLFFYGEAHNTMKAFKKRTLQDQAQELLSGMQAGPDGKPTIVPPPDWAQAYRSTERKFAYTLYDSSHSSTAFSPNLDAPLPLPAPGTGAGVHIVGPGRRAVLAVPAPNGSLLVVAREQADPEALAESLIEENSEHYLVLVPFALAAPLLIWWISGWSLRPLARASREAAAIGPAAPEARISTADIPVEIQPLVDAANGALDRLAEAYEAERRLTADAAHQLRTPVAVLDLRLQRAKLDGRVDWTAIAADMGQLRRLLDQLLAMAHKDHAARTDAIPANLSRIVRETAAQMLPIAEEAGRTITVRAADNAIVIGRPDDLRDMVANLLDNAIVHGRGEITVSVCRKANGRGDEIVLEVADEGEGVAEGLEEAVFDRFRKATANSPGAGLGLAIVRQVVRSHGGEAAFLAGAPSRIAVTLPAG
jgi:two-component system sensor histidine kinase QseC